MSDVNRENPKAQKLTLSEKQTGRQVKMGSQEALHQSAVVVTYRTSWPPSVQKDKGTVSHNKRLELGHSPQNPEAQSHPIGPRLFPSAFQLCQSEHAVLHLYF